jgi:biotin transport system permease protein
VGSLYSDIETWLHRVPAGAKLLVMAIAGTLLFTTSSVAWLGAAGTACLALLLSLGRAAWGAKRWLVSALIAALLVAAFHVLMGQPLLAYTTTMRLMSASVLGATLTLTTRPGDLVDVLERCLRPLARLGFEPERIALQMALMLRFVEHFFTRWQLLADAYRLRTGRAGGLRLIAPLSIQMLQTSRRVADALWARLGH